MSIPILMYHQIGEPNPKGTPFRGLTVHPDDFARQMRWMRFLGYRGLSMLIHSYLFGCCMPLQYHESCR